MYVGLYRFDLNVRVRFQIRIYDFVAVPARDLSADLPPEQDS
jgi:hypothetical protein